MHAFFCAVFLLVSFSETLIRGEQENVRAKHLFVQRRKPLRGSSLPQREIYLSDDGGGSVKPSLEHSTSRRSKRSTRETRSTKKDPTHTLHQFQDSHHMLIVQWSGFNTSDTVVVLTRDIVPNSKSTSYLYISSDYGKTYQNRSHNLYYQDENKVSKPALINRYYSSRAQPTWYIFVDITNNVIFTTQDDCKNLKSVKLDFKPSDITFHDTKTSGIMAYDDKTKKIYYSKDFGSTWNERAQDVISYFWGIENLDSDDVIYLEIDNKNGTSDVIRGHWDHKHYSTSPLLINVNDFEINDAYLFATKKGKDGLDLWVGYHYHDIRVAKFPNDLKRQEYYIADASESQVFVAVNHNSNTSHLYISDTSGLVYTKSLDRILFYSPDRQTDHWLRRYITETFVDLYPVASMRGVYLASQLSAGKPGTRKIFTKISYDKGRAWSDVTVPERRANGSVITCASTGTCSLHLAQHFAQVHPRYWAPTIMSKKSAPGLILSSGNIGERLSYDSNVYVSNDAGESWLEVLLGRWYYNFGDHGGVIVAVRQWSPTKELLYSTDEGLTWKRYNFTKQHIRVYGLLTEPGEKTTIFTIFGSYRRYHSWLVVQVDVKTIFDGVCTSADYETWTPYHREHGYGCILGQRLEYERRKRNATCYNGRNYDRPVNISTCYCSGQDYECDAGFKPWRSWFYLCLKDPNVNFDPIAPPRPCPRGTTYNVTQGYRKIAGDKCSGGFFKFWYEPYEKSCPFEVDAAFLLYAERSRIQYFDLTNNSHSTAVKGLKGAVAVAYDMRDAYIYWADMKERKIMRSQFNSTDKPIFIAAVKQVEGLDFDWTTDNLYWVDSVEKVIEVCRKDGLFRKTVHSVDLDKPRGLALDPHMGEMFWTDWGGKPKIEMSDMDGQNRVVLINSGIYWPNGLAIDIYQPEKSRILYYTDAYKDIIGSYNLYSKTNTILASKTDPKAHYQNVLKHPYSIAVDDKYVYWDDWASGKVFKVHKSFKGDPVTVINKAPDFQAKSKYEIKVYYKRSQHDNSSCTGVKCSQLCLPKPNNTYVCTCGDGLKLDPKTKKCKCLGGLMTLKNGTCKRRTGTCAPNEFSCNNGYCVPLDLKCDWHDDCGDNSDEETNCDSKDGCEGGAFHCPKEGKCIPWHDKCDGFEDCSDGFDEKFCSDSTCLEGQFHCTNGTCITAKGRCDGYKDCSDNSDEVGCKNFHTVCQKGEFMCNDGVCKKQSLRCNGFADCQDNSDEINCVPSCPNVIDWFLCYDKSKCIDRKRLCDGKFDCEYDLSDERCSTLDPSPAISGKQSSPSSKKNTLMWAIPVGVVFVVLLGALVYFATKSRRMQRSFYRLVRSDSFDRGVTYHNAGSGDEDDAPLIQGFSDDDPLVEA